MSRIFETETSSMASMGRKVMENAEQIATEVEGLIGRLDAVDWKCTAADSFHTVKEEWRLQVVNIKTQLGDVAERLGVNATTYDQVHVASQTGYERLRGQNLSI